MERKTKLDNFIKTTSRWITSTFVILCYSFVSCSSITSQSILDKAEKSFKGMILANEKVTTQEKKRFIENEGKFILNSRKKFFSQLEIPSFSNFYLVEIFDMSRDDGYNGLVKENSVVHSYKNGIKNQSSYEKVDFKDFKRNSPIKTCLLVTSENNIDKLIGEKDDSTFHFTVIITEVKNGEVTTYVAKNICVLD